MRLPEKSWPEWKAGWPVKGSVRTPKLEERSTSGVGLPNGRLWAAPARVLASLMSAAARWIRSAKPSSTSSTAASARGSLDSISGPPRAPPLGM